MEGTRGTQGMEGTENYDAASGAASALPNGKPRSVDVREIEDAISQLHKEHRDTGARAYILNLLVFTSNRALVERAHAISAQVRNMFPCRTIVMEADPAGDTMLDASVTASPQSDAAVTGSSEQITLRAAGSAVAQLPAVVAPILIPEIPVALCWLGDVPFGLPVFDSLMNTVDQLIVDSAQFAHPIATVERMHTMAGDQWSGVTFNDLAWARLLAWREATAQFFDPPATRPALDTIQRVTVTFAATPGAATNPTEVLLYTGWLASRLGWDAVPGLRRVGRDLMLVMRHSDAPVIVEGVTQQADAAHNGELLGVTLTADGSDGTMIFHLTLDATQREFRATTTQNGQTLDTHTLPGEERSAGDMVCDIVGAVRRDGVYEQSLDFVVRLAGSDIAGR